MADPANPDPQMEEGNDEEAMMDPLLYELPPFPRDHQILEGGLNLSPAEIEATYQNITIDGIRLPAMVVAGEPRVPLALFKRRMGPKFPDYEVENRVGEVALHFWILQLNAHLYPVSHNQMKELRILDEELNRENVALTELITQTDAERVLGRIREESEYPPFLKKSTDLRSAFFRVPVEHWMFGEEAQGGYLYPERKGRCIQCKTCRKFFVPEHFILHAHIEDEDDEYARTVHWGLNGETWRYALCLDQDAEDIPELVEAFNTFMIQDSYTEDDYYPAWYSRFPQSPEEAEPSNKRRRIEEEDNESNDEDDDEDWVDLSPEVIRVLETIADMPQLPVVQLNHFDHYLLSTEEEKLRDKAKLEAMSGKMFDDPVKDEDEIAEKALEMYRTQQPHIPDPEHFPKVALLDTNLLDMTEQLKELEALYPDGQPPPAAQKIIENLRIKLQAEAYKIQQHELIYATLLSAYKMLNMIWRSHVDPSQPFPEHGNFEEIAVRMAELDPMQFLTENKNLPPEVQMPPAVNIEALEMSNIIQLYQKILKNMSTSADPNGISNSFMAFSPNDLLHAWAKLNPTFITGMNGLNGYKLAECSSNGKIPETNGSKTVDFKNLSPKASNSHPQPLNGHAFPLMPTLNSLISPKVLQGEGLDWDQIRSQLFQSSGLGLFPSQ